jgi:hypothetical protein
MKLIHLDCDREGKASIESLVQAGYVDSYQTPDHKSVEGVLLAVKAKRIVGDIVVIDTINGLVSTINQGLVFQGNEGNVWDNRKKLVSDWDTYRNTQNLTNYLNMIGVNLGMMGIPVIWIAHERNTKEQESRTDPLSGGLGDDKYTANLQKGINEFLNAFCGAIIRLTYSTVPFTYEGVAYPRGTRTLVLNPTRDSSVGTRVDGEWLIPNKTEPKPPLPPFMVVGERDPYAFYRFVQLFGRVPASTLLYGPPKVCKTSFAAGAIYVPKG